MIQTAVGDLSNPDDIVQLQYSARLHRLLTDLTRSLLMGGHKTLRERAKPGAGLDKWLSLQTSVQLKGLSWTSLVLDGVYAGSFPMYRFLQGGTSPAA